MFQYTIIPGLTPTFLGSPGYNKNSEPLNDWNIEMFLFSFTTTILPVGFTALLDSELVSNDVFGGGTKAQAQKSDWMLQF